MKLFAKIVNGLTSFAKSSIIDFGVSFEGASGYGSVLGIFWKGSFTSDDKGCGSVMSLCGTLQFSIQTSE